MDFAKMLVLFYRWHYIAWRIQIGHVNGVALVLLPPFGQPLVSWCPVSPRLLYARLAHRHGHEFVVVA